MDRSSSFCASLDILGLIKSCNKFVKINLRSGTCFLRHAINNKQKQNPKTFQKQTTRREAQRLKFNSLTAYLIARLTLFPGGGGRYKKGREIIKKPGNVNLQHNSFKLKSLPPWEEERSSTARVPIFFSSILIGSHFPPQRHLFYPPKGGCEADPRGSIKIFGWF